VQHPLGAEIWSSENVHIKISVITRSKFTKIFFAEHERNCGRSRNSPIWNIFIRSGDICQRTLKSSKIRPNFPSFWPLNSLGKGPFKILDRNYKIEHTSEYRAKFRGDLPTKLGDYARGKNKCQQNISPRVNYHFRADCVMLKEIKCEEFSVNKYLAVGLSYLSNLSSEYSASGLHVTSTCLINKQVTSIITNKNYIKDPCPRSNSLAQFL